MDGGTLLEAQYARDEGFGIDAAGGVEANLAREPLSAVAPVARRAGEAFLLSLQPCLVAVRPVWAGDARGIKENTM